MLGKVDNDNAASLAQARDTCGDGGCHALGPALRIEKVGAGAEIQKELGMVLLQALLGCVELHSPLQMIIDIANLGWEIGRFVDLGPVLHGELIMLVVRCIVLPP